MGRGGRGGCPSGVGVGNGGLWRSEERSEGVGFILQLLLPSLLPLQRVWLGFWWGGEAPGDDEGGVGWSVSHFWWRERARLKWFERERGAVEPGE